MKLNKILERSKAVLELVRVRNCLLGFLGVLLGAALVYSGGTILPPEREVYYAGLAAAIILGAGNVINDYFDFEIDKINRPRRPLPSRRVSRSDALMLSIVMFSVGLALSKAVNHYCLIIALFNTVLLILYAKYSKRVLFLSNFTISYLVASIFIFGALATTKAGNPLIWTPGMRIATLLSLCAFLMTMSREIVKDIEDIEGDQKVYSVTLPIQYSSDMAKKTALTFTLAAVALSLLPVALSIPDFNLSRYIILIAIADAGFLISYTMHPSLAQQVMVAGMTLALTAFYAGAIH